MTVKSQKGKEIIEAITSYKAAKSNLEAALAEYESQRSRLTGLGMETKAEDLPEKASKELTLLGLVQKLMEKGCDNYEKILKLSSGRDYSQFHGKRITVHYENGDWTSGT